MIFAERGSLPAAVGPPNLEPFMTSGRKGAFISKHNITPLLCCPVPVCGGELQTAVLVVVGKQRFSGGCPALKSSFAKATTNHLDVHVQP